MEGGKEERTLRVITEVAGERKEHTYSGGWTGEPDPLLAKMHWMPLDDIPAQLELAGPVVKMVVVEMTYEPESGDESARQEGAFWMEPHEAVQIAALDIYQTMATATAWDSGGGTLRSKVRFMDRYGKDVARLGESSFTQARAE